MPYIIAEPCVDVKSGECVDVCPVEAIFLDTDLPDKWHEYIDVNAAFFRKNKAAPEPIDLETAFAMIDAVHGYAAENDVAVSAAVVDESGRPIAVARMEGAEANSMELALNKAYTAAAFDLPTTSVRGYAERPWFRSLVMHSRGRIMPVGGGFPIIDPVGEIAVIGAIGVAGGNNAEQDGLCCRVGMAVLEAGHH